MVLAPRTGRRTMKIAFRYCLGLVLAVIFAGAAVAALAMTAITVKDAVQSHGSLETYGARLRHYSDRAEADDLGLGLLLAPHPFLVFFGMLAFYWLVTIAAGVALQRLRRNRSGATPNERPPAHGRA